MVSFILALYVALLLLAAFCDLTRLVIPNGVVGLLAALFVVAAVLLPVGVDWGAHIGAGLAAGLLGTAAFARGKMGGGDVKFVAAVSLWAGLDHLLALLTATALAGGALALALLVVRAGVCRWAGAPGATRGLPAVLRAGGPVPYGVAIAAGGLLTGPLFPLLAAV